jgi:tetratricopeptide (TPR) repeat protein
MSFSNNPYVAGNPVGDSPAFVGRADILREVLRVLRHPKENAIVLYGQRRIGKTSVLQELETKLPKQGNYYPIFFDLQDKAQWPLARVLCELAQKISDKLKQATPNLGDDPETTFRHVWLPELLNNLSQESSLVFLFDEFDVLDDPESEKAGAAFFPYLRELLPIAQKHLNFVFVIGRKVDDLTNIALSLFKTTPSLQVSLFNQQDTIELVRFSETNKSLLWSDEAIEKIWQLTGGHPFLTQRLCSCIWERLYTDDPEKAPKVTPKEIEAAIPDTLSASDNALEWLWKGLPPVERMVISALASAGSKPIAENQLENLLRKQGVQVVIRELQTLRDWDLIGFIDGDYCFRVELIRRWIADYKPFSQVRKELDSIEPTADSLYQTGLGFYRVGQVDVSLTFLRQAVVSNPNHVSANQLLAEILLKQGQVSEARELLEKLYKHQPAVAHPLLIQALLTLAESNDNENQQIKLYKRILELDAEYQEARDKLQQILQRQQQQRQKTEKTKLLGKSLMIAIGKSLMWSISTFIFGLLPLWLVLTHNPFTVKSQIFSFEQFLMSGSLLFFVTAIVASITIDHFLFSGKNMQNLLEIIIFTVFPTTLIFLCFVLFSITFGTSIKDIQFEILYKLEINILLVTLFYATIAKFESFKRSPSQKNSTIQQALVKSVIWIIGIFFLGLSPLWLFLLTDLVTPSNNFHIEKFIIDGSLLFFVTAIVSSITIDYLLSMKTVCCGLYEIILFIIFPLLILSFCVALFYILYSTGINGIEEIKLLYSTQKGILFATFLYSFFVKYHTFK